METTQTIKLPSAYQPTDKVLFGTSVGDILCEVEAVIFTESKVYYNLVDDATQVLLKDVDSSLVKPITK